MIFCLGIVYNAIGRMKTISDIQLLDSPDNAADKDDASRPIIKGKLKWISFDGIYIHTHLHTTLPIFTHTNLRFKSWVRVRLGLRVSGLGLTAPRRKSRVRTSVKNPTTNGNSWVGSGAHISKNDIRIGFSSMTLRRESKYSIPLPKYPDLSLFLKLKPICFNVLPSWKLIAMPVVNVVINKINPLHLKKYPIART